jgi:N-acyl-D-amino-acid deacylase
MNKTFGKIGCAVLFALSFTLAAFAQDNPSNAYDFIIKNGRIIDGSGNPWVSGDVAIRGDRIAK